LALEGNGLFGRVVVEDGGSRHVAEFQAHAFAVLEIDGGEEDQRKPRDVQRTQAVAWCCCCNQGHQIAYIAAHQSRPALIVKRLLMAIVFLAAPPPVVARRRLTEADAIDIWIARWLRIRRKDLIERYACDPRRLYEIWEETRFAGSREKAWTVFAARFPGLLDRTDMGRHRRIPQRGAHPGQLNLFE
jgi:hypothetical protein